MEHIKPKNCIKTDFTERVTIDGGVILERFEAADVECELEEGISYHNSNQTLGYVAFPIKEVRFIQKGTTNNLFNPLARKQERINKSHKGKLLYMLLSMTNVGKEVLTIPTFRGFNGIYDGSSNPRLDD